MRVAMLEVEENLEQGGRDKEEGRMTGVRRRSSENRKEKKGQKLKKLSRLLLGNRERTCKVKHTHRERERERERENSKGENNRKEKEGGERREEIMKSERKEYLGQ